MTSNLRKWKVSIGAFGNGERSKEITADDYLVNQHGRLRFSRDDEVIAEFKQWESVILLTSEAVK